MQTLFFLITILILGFSTSVKAEPLIMWPYDAQIHKNPNGLQFMADSSYPQQYRPWRFTALGAGTIGLGAIGYQLVLKSWWDNQRTDVLNFGAANETINGANTDKITHFYAGYYLTNILYDGFRWSGMKPTEAYASAAYFNFLAQLMKDTRDGFSKSFSFLDILGGTLGGIAPLIQYHATPLQPFRFRFAYSPQAFMDCEVNCLTQVAKDMQNQDYFASYMVNDILSDEMEPYWPDPLAITVGMGGNYPGESFLGFANRRFLLGVDWDLENWWAQDSYAGRRSLFYLGAIKLPALTVIVYPEFQFNLLYPFTF